LKIRLFHPETMPIIHWTINVFAYSFLIKVMRIATARPVNGTTRGTLLKIPEVLPPQSTVPQQLVKGNSVLARMIGHHEQTQKNLSTGGRVPDRIVPQPSSSGRWAARVALPRLDGFRCQVHPEIHV
jgi:hypothetical protein